MTSMSGCCFVLCAAVLLMPPVRVWGVGRGGSVYIYTGETGWGCCPACHRAVLPLHVCHACGYLALHDAAAAAAAERVALPCFILQLNMEQH